ncbi:homocysteine S-methyltransferase family protein [Mannheimia pernigra]|uniref:Homocysteine S-methyltransferase family protein n=1 Tax=Mannheimia pernigra TaxID=111844 RepID=A0ABD7A897_9PAST|nr:homocysteine S-methyltransferase family protein [Mannheimia pernigra]QLB42393.1 homocysteine S-methyltransferase family protein [Mannheimia pernigra]QLB44257.1 homocysteine S-methyltransferase family protein [Mannheimia pernigra]
MSITILDGGMSRELMRRNAPFHQPEWSAAALYEGSHFVQAVHEDFIANGAEIITTNSYAVVPFHIGEKRFAADGKSLADLAGRLAKQAVKNSGNFATQIAGSLPPMFGSYRADLIKAERFTEIAQPLIDGLSPYVDIWLCETQSAIIEPISIKALLPKDNRPLWVSFTLIDDEPTPEPQLRSGENVKQAIEKMVALDVQAILFNCCQPEVISKALAVTQKTLAELKANHIRIGAYANAFAPQPKDATANDGLDEVRKDLDPDAYLAWAKKWTEQGATIIGGCCGIGVEYIETLAKNLK